VTCTFQGVDGEEQVGRPDALPPPAVDGSPHVGTRSGSIFGTAVGPDRIDLGQYVDQVSLCDVYNKRIWSDLLLY
jgi:hypothetical protein